MKQSQIFKWYDIHTVLWAYAQRYRAGARQKRKGIVS
jgi:hypothetical protein